MAGTAKTYFANRATLTVNDGSTDHVLAALHGVEITPHWEHIEEYAMDSILREDVARVKAKVDVKIKYAKFNPIVTEWWQMQVLAGSNTGADGTMADTNNVATFAVTGLVTDGLASGAQKLQAAVAGVYFESLPLVLQENQFIQHDLSGVGRTIVFSNPT